MPSPTKYDKLDLIGRGPECEVFRGRNRDIDVPVAIKALPEELRRNVNRRERYYAEAAAGANLQHDHLITVLDVDRALGWIVYELLPASAADQIMMSAASGEQVEIVLRDCLNALQHVHQQGFLHANLKPTNVFINLAHKSSSRRVKLADGRYFRQEDRGELPVPRGSHKYMAPELIDDSFGTVTCASDIYSLGIVMLEMLVGSEFDRHFRGVVQDVTDTEKGWIRWHTSPDEEPIATSQFAPGTSPRLATVLDRMLAKDLTQRYGSVADILEDLGRPETVEADPPAAAASPGPVETVEPAPPDRTAPKTTSSSPRARQQPTPDRFEIGPLPPWPEAPVVLRHASGIRAGEFVGLTSPRITVGSGLTCDVSFVEDGCPHLEDLSVEIQRETNGWVLKRRSKQRVLVNQDVVQHEAVLRSGDVIRLTPEGPDFQFILQVHNQKTLKSILGEHAPKALAAAIAAGKKVQPTHAPTPAGPADSASRGVAPQPVAAARAGHSTAGHSTAGHSTINAAPAAPTTPLSAAPSAPAAPYGANASPQLFGKMLDIYRSNKRTVIWSAAIAGVFLLTALILWFPGGQSAAPAPEGSLNTADRTTNLPAAEDQPITTAPPSE
ncbi:FHA domain-containing serine/threonine-protein kinase [Pirellulales bacterium]|nr:FHA domain-containing serine/threonine-protein kinase [Pirellulales bacterium]